MPLFNYISAFQEMCYVNAVSTVPVPAPQFKRYSAVSPYKILYSYVALVPAPSCIWQYKFVHKFAGTLDTALCEHFLILKITKCTHKEAIHTGIDNRSAYYTGIMTRLKRGQNSMQVPVGDEKLII